LTSQQTLRFLSQTASPVEVGDIVLEGVRVPLRVPVRLAACDWLAVSDCDCVSVSDGDTVAVTPRTRGNHHQRATLRLTMASRLDVREAMNTTTDRIARITKVRKQALTIPLSPLSDRGVH